MAAEYYFQQPLLFSKITSSPDRNPRLPAGREPESKVYCSPYKNPCPPLAEKQYQKF
jgi:hypothetical protein